MRKIDYKKGIFLSFIVLFLLSTPSLAIETAADTTEVKIPFVGSLKLFRDSRPEIPHADVAWLDNEHILLAEKYRFFLFFDRYRLISMNITTFDTREVLSNAESNFCFDHKTNNLVLMSFSDGYFGGLTLEKYGKLGKELTSLDDKENVFLRKADCRTEKQRFAQYDFYLREGDGVIDGRGTGQYALQSQFYLFKRADGSVRTIDLGEKASPSFHFIEFLNSYVRTRDKEEEVELLVHDHDLNIEKIIRYPLPAEYKGSKQDLNLRLPLKSGLLVIRQSFGDEKNNLMAFVKENGTAAKLLTGFQRATPSISPDGCHASLHLNFSAQSKKLAILDVCN